MPYDEVIESRIQKIVSRWRGTTARKMFGGVCHLLKGNMFCGVYKEFLIVRLGVDTYDDAMEQPHVRQFDITGRPMKGWVMVEPEGVSTDENLRRWLQKAKNFAKNLPPK